jgi:hypothetical protein
MTSYLHDSTGDWDEAFRQVCEVRAGLADWSRAFPGVGFAFIEANCLGGNCEYGGFCCRDGEVTLGTASDRCRGPGLHELAVAVGIRMEGTLYFEPFVRGYFAVLRAEQWAGCTRPGRMLDALQQLGQPLRGRRRRLLAAAYLGRVRDRLRDERCRRAAAVCERAADGGGEEELTALRDEIEAAWSEALRVGRGRPPAEQEERRAAQRELAVVLSALRDQGPVSSLGPDADRAAEQAYQAALIRDIVGDPFRPACLDPRWQSADVVRVAKRIDEDRAFDAMPVLADLLEDAGCADPQLLAHCRGVCPHVRGCWVVDRILGKS